MNIAEYMNAYSVGSATVDAVVWAFKNKKDADKVITHACASAIKEVIDGVRASKDGKSGNAQTVNELLYWANDYMPEEAKRIREFLVAFGPFVNNKKPFSIQRKGKPPLLVEPSLKFDLKKYESSFALRDSSFYAKEAELYTYTTYKKAMKQAEKQEAEQSKTEAERTKEAQEKLAKRVEKIKKDAAEAGLTAEEVGIVIQKQEPNTLPETPDAQSLIALIKRMIERNDISKDDKELCEAMLNLAATHYALKEKQKKAA